VSRNLDTAADPYPLFAVGGVQALLRPIADTLDAMNHGLFAFADLDPAEMWDVDLLARQFTALAAGAAALLPTLKGAASA
jgi:hypothetical protein